MMPKERTHPVDTHVGKRVRMRRLILGLSQTKLGDALDLTFQQVQKYEKGSNRIGASRLRHISQILQVPVEFFFKGAPQAQVHDHANNDAPSAEYVSEYLATSPPRMGCSSPKPSCRFQTRSFGDPSSILSSSSPAPRIGESFSSRLRLRPFHELRPLKKYPCSTHQAQPFAIASQFAVRCSEVRQASACAVSVGL